MLKGGLYVHMTGKDVPAPLKEQSTQISMKKSKPPTGSMIIRRKSGISSVSSNSIAKPKIGKLQFTKVEQKKPSIIKTVSKSPEKKQPTPALTKTTPTKPTPPTKPPSKATPLTDENEAADSHLVRPRKSILINDFPSHQDNKGKGGSSHYSNIFAGSQDIPKIYREHVESLFENVFSGRPFAEIGVNEHLCEKLNQYLKKDQEVPLMTIVQERSIPPILEGGDVLIKSQTGSGKTLAYAVPIVDQIIKRQPPVSRKDGILAIVIVPTRELAQQTYDWIMKLTEKLWRSGISIVPCLIRGGENRKTEKRRLRGGVNIIVATAGRLLDHINSSERLCLANVQHLVLDEADRMLEMGYEKDIAAVVDAISDAKKHGDGRRVKLREEERKERYILNQGKRKLENANDEYSSGLDSTEKRRKLPDSFTTITTDDKTYNSAGGSESEDEYEKPLEDIDSEPEEATSNNNNLFDDHKPVEDVARSSAPLSNANSLKYQTVMLSATLSSRVKLLAGINMTAPTVVDISPGEEAASMQAQLVLPKLHTNAFMIVPVKLRLVTLMSLIIEKCMYGQMRKMLVFMATQAMVDYHTELFNKVLARYGEVPDWLAGEDEDSEDETTEAVEAIFAGFGSKKKQTPLPKKKKKKKEKLAPLFEFMQLHGNMKQEGRSKVFERFQKCESGVMFCTDVASRGLDLPSVHWVVQYTPPLSVTDFVHRVGRTSRCETVGSAILFLTDKETNFIHMLDHHRIVLSQIFFQKHLQILTHPPPAIGEGFIIPRNFRQGAERLQKWCEKLLLADKGMHKLAASAFISFICAYASYPKNMMGVFCYKEVHQGHFAASFALKDAPRALGAAEATSSQREKTDRKEAWQRKEKRKARKVASQKRGVLPKSATISEFGAGLDSGSE